MPQSSEYEMYERMLLKGCWDPVFQGRRYARFYFGLNVIGQEAVTPENLHSFPIPLKRRDVNWARFKLFKSGPNYSGEKIRLDQEIKRMEYAMQEGGTMKVIAEAYLQQLKYISEGPYDSRRG